jgi:hypothetical protein
MATAAQLSPIMVMMPAVTSAKRVILVKTPQAVMCMAQLTERVIMVQVPTPLNKLTWRGEPATP